MFYPFKTIFSRFISEMTGMGKIKFYVIPGIFLILLIFTGCKDGAAYSSLNAEQSTEQEYVKKGEYLLNIMGCHDCHSPKQPGPRGPEMIPELMLSGFPADNKIPKVSEEALENGWVLMSPDLTAAAGPWGVSYAANITSDETGIGNWSHEQFKRALTEGKAKGLENGRDLLPPMPWQNYTEMEDEDIKALYHYLQSTPAVENLVPQPIGPDRITRVNSIHED